MIFQMIRFSLLLFFLYWSPVVYAQPAARTFDFNSSCEEAYKEIIRLRLNNGQAILDAEKKSNPANLIPYFLENYIDFFELYFNEDPQVYNLRKANLEKRLKLMDHGPASSPYYLFTKAVIHFQWAAVSIKFGSNWDAGWEFRRSFLQIKENSRHFNSFTPNAMLSGTMQVAAGTIPDGYKWLSNLLGIQGSIQSGMDTLKKFVDRKDPLALLFHDEAIFYYLYLQFYIQNKKAEVFDFIRQGNMDVKDNHLFSFLAANLAVNAQQSDYAEKILRAKNGGSAYLVMPVWDLLWGSARLNHLETDANIYLEKYLSTFKGNFYVKDVLQKLSWHYYLSGNQLAADQYRKQILVRGSVETEADKQALKEARSGKWPDKQLLKARLLDDGGYFMEALQVLQNRSATPFIEPEDQLEYYYRTGRINDDLGREEDAMKAYQVTIKMGASSKTYYAARAALQIGFIYEKRRAYAQAVSYFQLCLDTKDHDYKNSLDQKAKAGLERCRNQ